MTAPAEMPPLVTVEGATKRFGQVVANRSVDLAVRAGEIVALVGENGAGKSTLVNMLCGQLVPDEGRILIDGTPVHFGSTSASAAAGIGVVHQHFMLVPTLSVLDNLALALPELGLGRLDRRSLASRVEAVAARLGFALELEARIDTLDVAQQQRIEIIKALMHRVRLLILDEPTAVLGPEDKAQLFATIRRLKGEGTAVILITHKLDDIFAVADRAVIMRAGAVAATAPVDSLSASDIVIHMVGSRDVAEADAIVSGHGSDSEHGVSGATVCSVRDVALRRTNGSLAVSDVSLDLQAGEIVAVAGVDGNGQSEFVRTLAGMTRPDRGVVECLGLRSDTSGWTAAALREKGVAHVPEDRRRSGIIGGMSLSRNYFLRHMTNPALVRLGLVRETPLQQTVGARLSEFRVRSTGPADLMERLSGGNQQKVVLAREMDGEPRLILAAHPSRGLDIKTIRFVHRLLTEARGAGKTVLLLSSDLDEILQLADRVIVFAGGRMFGPAVRGAVGRDEIGAWIAGHAGSAA